MPGKKTVNGFTPKCHHYRMFNHTPMQVSIYELGLIEGLKENKASSRPIQEPSPVLES